MVFRDTTTIRVANTSNKEGLATRRHLRTKITGRDLDSASGASILATLPVQPAGHTSEAERLRKRKIRDGNHWEVLAGGRGLSRRTRWQRAAGVINSHPLATVASISVFYLIIAFVQANIKLIWLDEFITLYISRLGSVHAIWLALKLGADPNPPLSHILVMWSMRLFGEHAAAIRLPAILFSGMGILCLYFFLLRRLPAMYAASGALFFMSTAAFDYSFEARSYALMLGFAMLSLLLWRFAAEGPHPLLATAGMALALAAGISSNYYAVLAFFPIAAGEMVRNFENRRLDLKVWLGMLAGSIPLFFYLPLIRSDLAEFTPYAWNKVEIGVVADGYTDMVEVILWPALAVLAIGVGTYLFQRRKYGRVPTPVLPVHEATAIFAQMCYPIIAYVIAVAHAGMLSPRFVAPVCYGFAIATIVACYKLFGGSEVAGVCLLALMFCWVASRESVCGYWLTEQRAALFHVRDNIPPLNPGVKVAVSDSLLVLPLRYYSSPDLASRIVFPIDFDAIRRYKREDSPEQNLWAGRKTVFPLPVIPVKQFQEQNPSYFIITTRNNWMMHELTDERVRSRVVRIDPQGRHIGGFTPLSHGLPIYFEVGNAVKDKPAMEKTEGNIR